MQTSASSDNSRFADRYVLNQRLHTGASSEVWLAEDTQTAIMVALKILDRSAAEREAQRLAFEREWQIARALNHPHTVRALSWHDGSRPAYAMQYIDGTDFSDLINRGFSVWAPALLVIVDTLIYWHRKGVVHGDLKPSNLLLDRRGSAYLADFGAATIPDEMNASDTQDFGSPAYASPERLAGAPLQPADDVYSIARVITELAVGDPAEEQLVSLPASIVELVRSAQLPREKRPTMTTVREVFANAGVARSQVDLQSMNIAISRPAATVSQSTLPVQPKPHGAFEVPSSNVDASGTGGISIKQLLLGLVLILLLGVGFTQFLKWIARDASTPAQVGTAVSTAAPSALVTEQPEIAESAPAIDPADRLANREASEEVLGQLLSVLKVLELRAADRWAGAAYTEGRDIYARGDRAYLAADYAQANTLYAEALAILRPLTQQVTEVFERAMREGDAALLGEDPSAAAAAFGLALAVTPGNTLAEKGLQRANSLGAVLQNMALGALAERNDDPRGALIAFQDALDIDPLWTPAIDAVARVQATLAGIDFRTLMSDGYDALDSARFANAKRAFEAAAKLRPEDSGPRDGLLQVRLAQRLERINGLLSSARQAESDEKWEKAAEHYASVLGIDDSLDEARRGAIRVSERRNLADRASRVVANPDTLSDLDNLRNASSLLTQLQALSPQGPQLARDIDTLGNVLKKAAVPLEVMLLSDGLTSVALLRVERLGSFEQTAVRLRPGLYTAVGTRRGFVDKRVQFRVGANASMPEVTIICDTPI